jgi:DNA-binding NarL/FixJ family response regulator
MATQMRRQNPKANRIIIVDDHPMVREHLVEVMANEPDLAVCGEAEDRNQALELIEATRPHLAIIDLSLKGSHGFELIKDIHVRYPELLMLVVSMHDESLYAERVIRAGAHGYINKQEATRNILLAIRHVLSGQVFLSQKMIAHIATKTVGRRTTRATDLETLTDRELRVFELIGQGHSMRQIAQELHLDVKTVETYRARIKDKLQLKNAGEVLQYAIRATYSANLFRETPP